MDRLSLTRLRVLAAVHVVIGLLSLPFALILGLPFAPLLIFGPIWLVVLGHRLWRQGDEVGGLLRWTHVVVLVVAALLCAYGLFALRAAEQSAARGGGLLGAFGLLPLALGVVLGTTAVVSLWVARGVTSRSR
jgi:ABC-type Fe3+ transport system permease subunit